MPSIAETKLSLRIFGPSLDPDAVSRSLAVAASRSWRAGDEWIIRGHPPKTRRDGAWFLESNSPEDASVELHVRELFARATDDVAKWRTVTSQYKADLFFGLFLKQLNEGFQFHPDVLREIANRGLSVSFDVYGATGETTQSS